MRVWACAAPLAAVTAAQPEPQAWWTPSEAARHQAFSMPSRRRVFLAGRWLARWLFAQAVGGEPLRLALDGEGAPRCAALPAWALSISHSGDWVAAAVAEGGPLGLDLEWENPRRDWQGLARFLGLDAADAAAFYRHWTLGEAWIKADTRPRALHEAAPLRWQAAANGEAWQARDGERGLHVALQADGEPRWLAWPGAAAPAWTGAARWTQSTPKS